MFDLKNILMNKVFTILIILLILLGSKYNYAYSDNKLIINENVVNTYENMYTQDDINYINMDLLINSGLNITKQKCKLPLFTMISSDKGYILLMNHSIISNTMIEKENILKINDNIFVAAKTINSIDNTYSVNWNGKYKFLRIKKTDSLVTDEELTIKYPKELGIYQIDGVYSPIGAKKFAYLTFDDGPSRNITPQILDILKETGTKATFFINGVYVSGKEDILKRMVDEGHTIGNHTYSHKSNMYKSIQTFKDEVKNNSDIIYNATGYVSTVFRAPYGKILSDAYKSYLKDNGYKVYYWNVDPGDSTIKNVTSDILINNVNRQIQNKEDVIIIMHDMATKEQTLKSIRGVIKVLWENGYELKAIDNNIQMNTTARVY